MYTIKITARAKRELKQISKEHSKFLASIFEELKEDPWVGKSLTRELTGRFSYRAGMYRIIYKVNKEDKIVQIITAGHRSTVYN